MPDNLYTVSKFIPDYYKNGGNVMELLESVRDTVRIARNENPMLENCQLHDVGFIQQPEGLEVKLYFTSAGLTT